MGELLRPGKAGSNTAVDHVAVLDAAMAQLPEPLRRRDGPGRVAVLVRTDAAGATHQFAAHLAASGAQFSLGANLGENDNPIWPHRDGLIWPHLRACLGASRHG